MTSGKVPSDYKFLFAYQVPNDWYGSIAERLREFFLCQTGDKQNSTAYFSSTPPSLIKSARPRVRPSVCPSIHKTFLRFRWNL